MKLSTNITNTTRPAIPPMQMTASAGIQVVITWRYEKILANRIGRVWPVSIWAAVARSKNVSLISIIAIYGQLLDGEFYDHFISSRKLRQAYWSLAI